MNKKRFITFIGAGLFLINLFLSCNPSSTTVSQIGKHKTEQYTINPKVYTGGFKNTQYSIDSICSLNIPDDIIEIGIDKISVTDDRIFILDTRITNKLYVFDNNGNLKTTIGERGKAKGEFIGKPDDFFVDKKKRMHVFDMIGHKIIVFDKNGSVDKEVETSDYFPLSFGLTSNNNYMMYFSVGHKNAEKEKEAPSSLLLLDPDCKNHKQIMASDGDLYCSVSIRTFYKDDERLSFIPPFSDSVIVFRNDSVEKVVLFDFGGKILSKEMPEVLNQQDDYSFMSNYKGVLGLNRYHETDSLIYLEYIYQDQGISWLYNKKNGQVVNGTNIFEGINPYSYYFIDGNQIIAYVDTETVKQLQQYYNNKSFQENLKKSPQQMKDLVEGKIKAPALFFITIK